MRVPRWEPRNRKSKVLDCLAALSKERRENPSHALMESIFERRNPRMIDFGPWLHRKGVSLLLWAATSPEAASCARRSPVRTTKPVRGGRPAKSTRSCGMPRSPACSPHIWRSSWTKTSHLRTTPSGWKSLHCSPCRSWDGASLSAALAGCSPTALMPSACSSSSYPRIARAALSIRKWIAPGLVPHRYQSTTATLPASLFANEGTLLRKRLAISVPRSFYARISLRASSC
jgi:hypothetical protein